MADLLVLPRLAKACTMVQASAETLEHTGPEEKQRVVSVPQRDQLASNAGVAFTKRKRNRAVCPEYQIIRGERVKVGESRTLARKRGIKAKAWRGEGALHSEGRQIPRRKKRTSKKSLPRKSKENMSG